jgi:plasmid stabilization system protein ParE
LYIAIERGNVDMADRVVDEIFGSVLQISKHPNIGRRRKDLRKGLRRVMAAAPCRRLSRGGK